MASIGKVFGVDKVLRELTKAGAKHKGIETKDVLVAYTANYALHVHENEEVNKKERARKGQSAKFIEKPMRELANSGVLANLVTGIVRGGGTVLQGLKVAGLRILRESLLIVPRDTSHLAGSGTVRVNPPGPAFESSAESQSKRASAKAKQNK